MESCLWARCPDMSHVSTSYVVYFYGEEYPICVAVWEQIRGVKGYGEYLDACLDGLGNLDATFHHVVVNNIRL